MVVIRPVALEDLDDLLRLAEQTGFGLTTLPRDRELIRRRISSSVRAFENLRGDSARGECYLLVLEDVQTGRVVGTSSLVSKVGGFEPFYAYRVETSVHHSDMLKVHREIQVLHLVTEHNGPSEIGSLFLDPAYRRDGNGRLLSLARFLFLAQHRELFDPTIIAEMRGVIDDQGRSAFWDALGRHFFDIDLPTADYLSMVNKRFIADLMPKHPIYIPLLPEAAQAVIAKVHPQTAPALKILEDEGFRYCSMVDIFEAGPVVSCPRDQIRTVRESISAEVVQIADDALDAPAYIMASAHPASRASDFRACRGPAAVSAEGKAQISAACALALKLRVGDPVRLAKIRVRATDSASGGAAAEVASPVTPPGSVQGGPAAPAGRI